MAEQYGSFESYKEFHENYMLNHNGTSLLESAVTIIPPPAALLLCSAVLPVIRGIFPCQITSVDVFILEFIILVLPMVFCYTALSVYIPVISLTFVLMWIALILTRKGRKSDRKSSHFNKWLDFVKRCSHPPFITLFRSYTNVLTCLCILAVDFRVFPRRFAKTEVDGYGLMDTGTGLFVVANALVYYKSPVTQNARNLQRALKSSAPMLALGFVRCFATSVVNYQVHVSEYGSNWNFFFSLSITQVLSAVLLHAFGNGIRSIVLLFLTLSISHEFALSFLGLRGWVLSDQTARLNFVSSNREGLVSLVGYVCLYFGGTLISSRIFGRPRLTVAHWLSLWKELMVISLFMWGMTHVMHEIVGVSRRLADLGYIVWILAYSVSSLTLFLTAELVTSGLYFYSSSEVHEDGTMEKLREKSERTRHEELMSCPVPTILEAVNYNGLAFFLMGNIMTGAVNICLHPLNVGTHVSIIILILYMLSICSFTQFMYNKKIKLKLF